MYWAHVWQALTVPYTHWVTTTMSVCVNWQKKNPNGKKIIKLILLRDPPCRCWATCVPPDGQHYRKAHHIKTGRRVHHVHVQKWWNKMQAARTKLRKNSRDFQKNFNKISSFFKFRANFTTAIKAHKLVHSTLPDLAISNRGTSLN